MDDRSLHLQNISVFDFCDRAGDLLNNEDYSSFVRFVLTGRLEEKQAVIDAILNRIPDDESFGATRDYDSLLGIDPNIRLNCPITVYPVSKKEDVLSKNIHVRYDFKNSKGVFSAPVHSVPNLCIGKWNVHNTIRVLIPELYHENRSQFLSQDEQKIFYEAGLRPAIEFMELERSAEWPATYDDEMFRARGRNGQLSFQTKILPGWLVSFLGDNIRSNLEENGYSWGEGLVFLHQIRGVKHATSHSLRSSAAGDALRQFLEQNSLDSTLLEINHSWWVDVGLEINSKDDRCLAWRTDSHFHIVQHVMRISVQHADKITTPGSSKYTRDLTSHLTAVSGCRIAPGAHSCGRYGVKYLQMYTTDKSLTYRQDQGHYGKFITCTDILRGKAEAYIKSLYNLYGNAIKSRYSLARLEARVPLHLANQVFINITEELLRGSLVSFSRDEWWQVSLRAYRALAISYVLEWQTEGETCFRVKWPALILMAGSAWLLNGLHSTPDKGASSKELMAAMLPHVERRGADREILAYGTPTNDDDVDSEASTESDEDLPRPTKRRRDAVTLPAFPYGIVFLRNICVGEKYPVPRIRNEGLEIKPKAFRYFFGMDFHEIEGAFFGSNLVRQAHPSRVSNKVKRTAKYYNWDDLDEPSRDFDLDRRGYRLPSPAHDAGSDASEDERGGEEGDNIDTQLTNIWRQFLLDITAKAPNKRRADDPSYCILTKEQRLRVNEATYKNPKLSSYFLDCQWKIADKQAWSILFDRLFPDKHSVPLAGKVQNYLEVSYYLQWAEVKQKADDDTLTRMRQALKKKFDGLYWMPFADSERIWRTKVNLKLSKSSGVSPNSAAPQVLVNGREPGW